MTECRPNWSGWPERLANDTHNPRLAILNSWLSTPRQWPDAQRPFVIRSTARYNPKAVETFRIEGRFPELHRDSFFAVTAASAGRKLEGDRNH